MNRILNTLLMVLLITNNVKSSSQNLLREIKDRQMHREMRTLGRALMEFSHRTVELRQRSMEGGDSVDDTDFSDDKSMVMRDGKTSSFESTGSADVSWNFLLKMMGLQGVALQSLKSTVEVRVGPSRTLEHSLYCRNGLFLEILKNGTARGTWKTNGNANFRLKFHLLGPQVVQIQGSESKMYLAMDEHGKVYGSKEPTLETVFYFSNNDQYFLHFQSLYYRMVRDKNYWYLGLKRNGYPKKASTSTSTMNNAQFLIHDLF